MWWGCPDRWSSAVFSASPSARHAKKWPGTDHISRIVVMARHNAFGFDLLHVQRRQSLRPRYAPYWQVTEYGRAVRYQLYPSGASYWMARLRLQDESYHQHRIGLTDDNPDAGKGLSFEQACAGAETWYTRVPQTRGRWVPLNTSWPIRSAILTPSVTPWLSLSSGSAWLPPDRTSSLWWYLSTSTSCHGCSHYRQHRFSL